MIHRCNLVLCFLARYETTKFQRLAHPHRGYDHESVEKIDRDTVGALVVGAPDLSDASVGRDNEHRREVALESTVEPRKALNVEHVHLKGENRERAGRKGEKKTAGGGSNQPQEAPCFVPSVPPTHEHTKPQLRE